MYYVQRAVLAVLFLVLSCRSLPAAQQWTKLTSDHFELYTTAGEGRGRDAILHFEQVRSFFLKAGIKDPGVSGKVRIIGFPSAKAYEPYRPNAVAFAYYLPGFAHDYIVMQQIDHDTYPAEIHEYVHLLVRHSGIELPIWLNEGLADLYSTLEPIAKKVKVGEMIPGRLQVLSENKLLDLNTLMKVDYKSPYYNESNRANVFYAESWALTHMVVLSDAYRPKSQEFMRALTPSADPGEVFQKVYGKSLAQVQKELDGYMHANSYKVAIFDAQLEKATENPAVGAAPPAETGLVLADLLFSNHKEQQVSELLDRLAQENPNAAEIPEAQGYFAWRSHKSMEEVQASFAKAVKLGSSNSKMYYDYALMIGRGANQEAIPLLKKAVELQPDFKDARIALAGALYNDHQYGSAVVSLNHLPELSRDEGLRVFRMLAYAYSELGQYDDAKQSAEQLQKISKTPEEVEIVLDLLSYLDRTRQVASARQARQERQQETTIASAAAPSSGASSDGASSDGATSGGAPSEKGNSDPEARPRLQRRAAPVTEFVERTEPKPVTIRIEGTLYQFDCLGNVARLTVLVSGKRVALKIDDPATVLVSGTDSGSLDFSCGRQQPLPVTVDFESKVDGELGTAGVIRAIKLKSSN